LLKSYEITKIKGKKRERERRNTNNKKTENENAQLVTFKHSQNINVSTEA